MLFLLALAFADDPAAAPAEKDPTEVARDERAMKDMRGMKDYFSQTRDMRSLLLYVGSVEDVLLDRSGKPMSCWTSSGGSPRLTISSSCSGFVQR